MKESDNTLLGLKAIIWDQTRGVFRSPSRQDFIWDQTGWAEAVCTEKWQNPEHTPPAWDCTCGIYAANNTEIVKSYTGNPNAIIVLVMACGESENHSGGFRSQAAQIVAVVDTSRFFETPVLNRQAMCRMIGSQYFGVDILDLDVALEMIDMSWRAEGYEKRGKGYYRYGHGEEVRVQKAG